MVATIDERRRVAKKLREYASWDEEGDLVDCQEWGESVLNLLDCGDTEGENYAALADLIDPGEGQKTPDASTGADRGTRVDRGALLALADKMERIADVAAGHTAYADRFDFTGFARRIREALGEVDGHAQG